MVSIHIHTRCSRGHRVFLGGVACLLALGMGLLLSACRPSSKGTDDFVRWMNVGKNQYEQGQADKAIEAFAQAVALQPTHPDARLNLANAYLLADQGAKAKEAALAVLQLDPQSAAARYVAGCASLRLGQTEEAIKFLQECRDIDVKVNTVSFQLARAHQNAAHYAEAAELLEGVIQWEPQHPAAHYILSQVLLRLGKRAEAQQAMQRHTAITAEKPSRGPDPALLERCDYTLARVPFVLEQPVRPGVSVRFADMTATALGASAAAYRGPVGILDIDQRGQNDLFVREGDEGFRLLLNSNGVFRPSPAKVPGIAGTQYQRCLVGDLNNDRFEDIVVLGDRAVQVFRLATNGAINDATAFAGMKRSAGLEGVLVDLDLTGKLDLMVLSPTNREPRLLRNLGPMYFKDVTVTSGIPATLTQTRQILAEDWNGDDLMDVLIAREGQPPMVLIKERGGLLVPTNTPSSWIAGEVIAAADLDNDYRTDLVIAGSGRMQIITTGNQAPVVVSMGQWPVTGLHLWDYDNDGWLDVLAVGHGLRLWRNLGQAGFEEMTQAVGMDRLNREAIASVGVADFDQDGDSDLVVAPAAGGLQVWRNEGGNLNHQLKLRLAGNRSNASGLGVRLEVKAATWRALRTVQTLPVEIGLGKFNKPDTVRARWSDLSIPVSFELTADPKTVWTLMEIELPTGSCPYLYAWDGTRYRFITDILGASPLGLRATANWFVEADPEEYVSLGDETQFVPQAGEYRLQVTEELREVLYLDEAKLFVVDHPPGTRVGTTSKMLPGRPFVPHELWTLDQPHPLRHATDLQGVEVTAVLAKSDRQYVSPAKRRVPQLRGLAEPSGVVLDFGLLPVHRPLVLVLDGWLRFGGGMANVGASHDPALPFPFPRLEVEVVPEGQGALTTGGQPIWKPVEVVVGVPCGKTKTILVDLAGKLPPNSHRLRLTTAYELHWDQIELWEHAQGGTTRIAGFTPDQTDLHWRGFSEFEDLPWHIPLTPDYGKVRPEANWRITPTGWCTRYGAVDELIARKDNALVLLNGGDELTLAFAANRLPPKPAGYQRAFFFYSVGWDKDSDFHVAAGTTVEPLPFHGLDDQNYGRQPRPPMAGDEWITKYNTRWVGPMTLSRAK